MAVLGTASQHRRKRDRYLESWWPEIIASLTSLASVAAIIGCLLAWKGRPIFDWHRITPNTIVAILATIARICNGISVSSALGQFKWLWHHQKARPLWDFALISGATTGPWDSFKLLIRTRSLSIMALGCWITLLVLAFDTFVQQIVAFGTRTDFRATSSNAIPFASTWNGGEAVGTDLVIAISEEGRNPPRSDEMELLLGFPMQGAIISGLSSNDTQLSQQISALCPTGNCQWENYQSLGVCSQCNDLGNVLQKREIPDDAPMAISLPLLNFNNLEASTITEWYLPNGLRLNNANTFPRNELAYPGTVVMTAQAGLNPDQTITFQDMSTMLLSISLMKVDKPPDNYTNYLDWADTPVSATECAIYFCIQELNTTMVNGTLHDTSREISSERVLDSYQFIRHEPAENGWREQKELFNDTFWSPRTNLQIKPALDSGTSLNQVIDANITQNSIDSLVTYLNTTFNGGALASRGRDVINSGLTGLTGMVLAAADRTVGDGGNPYLYAPPTLSTLWLAENITTRFANLAKSMTNSMRTTSSVPTSPESDNSQTPLANTVSSLEGFQVTVLAVRWEWLILPAACVLLGCLFLALAVVQTRRHDVPIWKAHALAAVLHGFERVPDTEPYDDGRLTQMERFAKGTFVRFVPRERERSQVRGDAWFLEEVSPRERMGRGDEGSEIAMVDRVGVSTGGGGFAYKGLGGGNESEIHLGDGRGSTRSHSTGVDPFEGVAGVQPQPYVGGVGEQRIPRKSLRGSIVP